MVAGGPMAELVMPVLAAGGAGVRTTANAAWRSDVAAVTAALLTLVGPWWLGHLLGRLVTRWLPPLDKAWQAVLLVLVPPAIPLLLPPFFLGLGIIDYLVLGLGFGLGLVTGGHRIGRTLDRRNLYLLAGVVLVCLVVGEWVASRLPEPHFAFLEARFVSLRIDADPGIPSDAELQVRPLYPAEFPDAVDERVGDRDRTLPIVLHIGDSMVHGVGVGFDNSFAGVLDRLDPEHTHVNAGVPGTGTDYHVLLVANWLEAVHPARVVFYVFGANDVHETGKPYAFCDNGSLLDFGESPPTFRCREPVWGGRSLSRFLDSPPPFFLRVAAAWSPLARQLCALQWRVVASFEAELAFEPRLERFMGAIARLRTLLDEAEVPLFIVLLPSRQELENQGASAHDESLQESMLRQRLVELPVPVHEVWPLFSDVVARDGSEPWFLNEIPGDIHFSVAGHERVARWLLEHLR